MVRGEGAEVAAVGAGLWVVAAEGKAVLPAGPNPLDQDSLWLFRVPCNDDCIDPRQAMKSRVDED